ncbi:type I 3-dehydroquinate dehydratase [Treponema sp.]|uniref:type I 3-dehydroquinate dehydratase n=1 Tax=Treponema sp. TaxID=166 RepID=UPI0025E5224F|nr:type I 3-dehydroquinate dehydratase [Treponema sp.]MCR5217826.1 type I 3-dehydroquinate dehydratase [Treponema sp.]
MEKTKICLTLTGSTIAQNLELIEKYRNYIDIAELRVDLLEDDERLRIREFPSLAGIPCLLTIRREIDGGQYRDGEGSRATLFAMALSFAEESKGKNFEYVDFEEDFRVSSLQDAALAFGIKIIRSVHSMHSPIKNLKERLSSLCTTGFEIPKIALMPKNLDDVREVYETAASLKDNNHILLAMGPLGVPTRLLGNKMKNYLTYVSAPDLNSNISNLAHLDPVTVNDVYHIKDVDEDTKLYGITGWPLVATSSPALHNQGYQAKKMNAIYIPFKSEKFDEALRFADALSIDGFSVTIPHKETAAMNADFIDDKVRDIGASNTLVKSHGKWNAYNTDCTGFSRALLEFTGLKNLRHKKVAIIGAGGAAKGIAWAVKNLHGSACVFNRTIGKAKMLAERYGFEYASLGPESADKLRKYSNIIIQTTSKGMNSTEAASESNDPIYFYNFTGMEILYDIVYVPAVTPVMERASQAGCKVCNGYNMLKYQGYEQFELFTGEKYDGAQSK